MIINQPKFFIFMLLIIEETQKMKPPKRIPNMARIDTNAIGINKTLNNVEEELPNKNVSNKKFRLQQGTRLP